MTALLTFVLLLLTVLPVSSATYRASPTGSGTTCSAVAPCTVQQGLSILTPGDTLELNDGTYTGATGMIVPPAGRHGTSGARITVKALNDGKALIDGQSAHNPILLSGVTYWTIEGVNARRSSCTVLQVGQNAHNTIIRRVTAWDAHKGGNCHILLVWTSDNVQLLDNFAIGTGRKSIAVQSVRNTCIARNVALKTGSDYTGSGAGTSDYTYNSYNTTYVNNILMVDLYPGSNQVVNSVLDPGQLMSYYDFGSPVTHKVFGNIFYRQGTSATSGQLVGNASTGLRTSVNASNVRLDNVDVTVISRNNLTMRRTAAVPATGHDCPSGTSSFGGTSTCDQSDWTDSVGTLSGTHTTENGNIAIGSFNNGLLQLSAAAQPTNGAWIRHPYTCAGTLDTTKELWPWGTVDGTNMNQRIKDTLVASGYAVRGLDGKGATDVTALILGAAGSTLSGAPPLEVDVVIQPVSTPEDTIIPGFQACVKAGGVIQTTHTAAFTVAITTNPSSGTLGPPGALTVTPTNGCATFNGLSIDNPGTGYVLTISSTGATAEATTPFDITAAPPTPSLTSYRTRTVPIP